MRRFESSRPSQAVWPVADCPQPIADSFFEVRKVFLATDDRSSFCLLTIGQSDGGAEFAFSLLQTADLADDERRFRLLIVRTCKLIVETRIHML
jgi:hypothetical protein